MVAPGVSGLAPERGARDMARSRLLRFGGAGLAVAVALPLTLLLSPVGQVSTPLFMAAVMMAAWYGGLGPGLLATALSALALDFLLAPTYSLGTSLADGLRVGVFVLVAVFLSSLNAARRRLAQALREQDRRKDELLAIVAHELRNPLAAIFNCLQIRGHCGTGDWPAERTWDIVERQALHMTRLIEDLLDVTRINQGKVRLCKEHVDVAKAAARAVEAARPAMEARGHRLEVWLPPRPLVLEADPTRLEQMIVNLLVNAAKYTEPHGRIRLAAEQTDGQVVLRVSDTGVGLSPGELAHVFDLFVQAGEHSRGGLGVGLNLVRRLVELHGGNVAAYSDGPGQGSEFVVRLPARGKPPGESPRTVSEGAVASPPRPEPW